MKAVQMIAKKEWVKRLCVSAAIAVWLCGAGSSAEEMAEKPLAVDAERYADLIETEVFDVRDLAEGAEIQRRFFNRITPPGISLFQPMVPPVAPFDSKNFDDAFLDDLLGEDKNSVAIYPLSLALDPKTRETLVYNAEGQLIATIPPGKASRTWPEDADPSRVTLQLDLLPSEDIEPYLYTESRIEQSVASVSKKSSKFGSTAKRNLGASEFGICNIQKLTNGNMRLTLTNGADSAEVFTYTVLHTSSVVVVTWTNEESIVFTDTNIHWTAVSPMFNGLKRTWACTTTNLALTNGVGVWVDENISSNARVRFYGVANRMDSDREDLTDGTELFVTHTDPNYCDTDEDGLLDGYDIQIGLGDERYNLWTNMDPAIVFEQGAGYRVFKGELSADADPLDADTDDDDLLDGWEVINGLIPTDADGVNGPEGDLDEDGFDNGLEFELGAPANNGAWNGNELAYQLTHAHPATNARWGATNLIGMRVNIDRSADCGGSAGKQDERDHLDVPALLACGYYIDITVTGSVEAVDDYYDEVSFEAFTNTFYFMGHDDIGQPESCVMVAEGAMRNSLIFGNSTVNLRYNTVGYKWHSNAYAQIIAATNTGTYHVVVDGDDAICVGETTSYDATGAAGPPYTWLGSGTISVNSTGGVTGLAPGFAMVIASDNNGCSGEKQVAVLKPDMSTPAPLADRTLHPTAARRPLLLKQTLPAVWNGLMQLSLSGANAYWTPTGGMPIASGIFTNSQLPQTVYLEGDGCGSGQAGFSIVGPPGCGTNVPLQIFGMNATLAGVAELDEEIPGGFIADHTTHTNAPRTLLTLAAYGPSSATGNVVLAWNSSLMQIYTVPTGGTALAQFSRPYNGFNGTNLYVEGIAPGSNTLSWSYSGQSDCEDKITVTVLSVDIKFADPDDAGWVDLEEKKVILSDNNTRIKLKITPQLSDLQTIFTALGTALKIKTSGTSPAGQDYTLTSQNTTLVQGSGYSEMRVSLTRDQLKTLGVLPSQEADSVTEKAWLDHGSSSSSDPSNLTDGNAYESGLSDETRGKSTNYGDLESTPPNSLVDKTFFVAAGREIITAEYGCGVSHKRQLMNQSDHFYFSGHGSHADAILQGGFAPGDVAGYWDKDLDYVIIAGCAVLDIKNYRAQSFGFFGYAEWLHANGDWSPGAQWEPNGPSYLIGYNWNAPRDNQGSAGIISNFLSALSGGASIVNAWKQANDLGVCRNACVIDCSTNPHVYWYWDETSGTAVWTNIIKSGGSW